MLALQSVGHKGVPDLREVGRAQVPNGLGMRSPIGFAAEEEKMMVRLSAHWRSWLLAWIGTTALCAVIYFWGYQKPADLTAFAPAVSWREYAGFILEFLGGILLMLGAFVHCDLLWAPSRASMNRTRTSGTLFLGD